MECQVKQNNIQIRNVKQMNEEIVETRVQTEESIVKLSRNGEKNIIFEN